MNYTDLENQTSNLLISTINHMDFLTLPNDFKQKGEGFSRYAYGTFSDIFSLQGRFENKSLIKLRDLYFICSTYIIESAKKQKINPIFFGFPYLEILVSENKQKLITTTTGYSIRLVYGNPGGNVIFTPINQLTFQDIFYYEKPTEILYNRTNSEVEIRLTIDYDV